MHALMGGIVVLPLMQLNEILLHILSYHLKKIQIMVCVKGIPKKNKRTGTEINLAYIPF